MATDNVTTIEHGVRICTDQRGANHVETGRYYYVVVCTEDDVIENEGFDTAAERNAFIDAWIARYPQAEIVHKREPLTFI
jgi:hypothetical protein